MPYSFCTCFDRNYFLTGYALYRSLHQYVKDFVLYVAALDEECFKLLTQLKNPQIVPISLAEIEAYDPEFAACKNNRSRVEYIFTLSPVLPLYLFHRFPDLEILNYLDADQQFYASPAPLYEELGARDILIVAHNFGETLKWREKFGLYNVSFQLYRNSMECRRVLQDYRMRCLAWCYDRVESERFADQKYLNLWPQMTASLVVAQHPGAAVAPWNWMTHQWSFSPQGRCQVDNQPLLFYHFQGCRLVKKHLLSHNLGSYTAQKMPSAVKKFLYQGYLNHLRATRDELMQLFPEENFPLIQRAQRLGFSPFRQLLSGLYHHNLMWVD